MRTALILYFALISNFLFGQTYNSVILDSEIEAFIQWEINNTPKYGEDRKLGKKVLYYKPESWKTAQTNMYGPFSDTLSFEDKLYLFLEQDTIFSKEDKVFMSEQYDSELINEWKIKFNNCRYTKRFGKNNHQITIPLFSKDLKKVLFWKYFYCGSVCAYAQLYIYKKNEEKLWVLIGTHGFWMS